MYVNCQAGYVNKCELVYMILSLSLLATEVVYNVWQTATAYKVSLCLAVNFNINTSNMATETITDFEFLANNLFHILQS